MNIDTKKCPYCAEEINKEAIKCKHCGEILDSKIITARAQQNQQIKQPERLWSPGVAALLSFIIPGAGQIYKGNIFSGIIWFTITIIAYFMLIIPGLILHLVCIIAAASGDPYR